MNHPVELWAGWRIREARRSTPPGGSVELRLLRGELLSDSRSLVLLHGVDPSRVHVNMTLLNVFDQLPESEKTSLPRLTPSPEMTAWVEKRVAELKAQEQTNPGGDGFVWFPGIVTASPIIKEAQERFPGTDVIDMLFSRALADHLTTTPET